MKKIGLTFFVIVFLGCSPAIFKSKWTNEIAPATFTTRFETSKGSFDIEIRRAWSPKAADRFFQLVQHNYFEKGVFYRVIPEFVVQFGSSDITANRMWNEFKVPDEKVILGNTKGTLSFARSGKETRTSALFINLTDNSRLDTLDYNDVKGFPAFGKVTQGMDVVLELFAGYASESASKTDLMYTDRTKYFSEFPKLDTIQKAYFIKN